MSRTRRNFSAKLKLNLVLKLLKGEKISTLSHPKTKYNLIFSAIGKRNLLRKPALSLIKRIKYVFGGTDKVLIGLIVKAKGLCQIKQ